MKDSTSDWKTLSLKVGEIVSCGLQRFFVAIFENVNIHLKKKKEN